MSEFVFSPDVLFAGDFPISTESATILSGSGVLPRGRVLGMVDASGKLTNVDTAGTTGTEMPYAVLAETVDATSADAVAPVYLTGEFNPEALSVGSGTVAGWKRKMRNISLFQRNVSDRG